MLRITDWDKHFENNRTRELKNMQWIPLPNKHDGDGYTELMDHEDGVAHYGAWVLILQVASKCDPRGTLLRGCKNPQNNTTISHDFKSLSRITRCPEKIIKEAVVRLKNIGWIEEIEPETPISQECAAISQGVAEIPHPPALNGMEWNGIIAPTCEGIRKPGLSTKREKAPNPIWDTLCELFNLKPVTKNERSALGKICRDMKAKGAVSEEIKTRAERWSKLFPGATLTEHALLKHWDRLATPPTEIVDPKALEWHKKNELARQLEREENLKKWNQKQ